MVSGCDGAGRRSGDGEWEGEITGSGCLGAGWWERPAYSSGWRRDSGGWTSSNRLRLGRSADRDTEGFSNVDGTGNRELNSVWAGGIVAVLPVVTLLIVLMVVKLLGGVIRV